MAPMMAMMPAHTMTGYYQVQPMQTSAFGLGQQSAMPNQEAQETQQFFQRFLTEQGPQIFQMFQQWRQMQTMEHQPMVPVTQLAQVFQQHPPPMNMGITYQNPVVHHPHTPQMQRQTRIPIVGETLMTTPATLVQTTSATPEPSSRRVLRNASPGMPLKKENTIPAKITDTANKVGQKTEHRRNKSKKNGAASEKFEMIDLTEPKEVKVKQKVEAAVPTESRDDPEPKDEEAYKARQQMKREKKDSMKQELGQELQPAIVTKSDVNGSDDEATKVKPNGKRSPQDAILTGSNAAMSKTKKIKMKHEAIQELQPTIAGGGGAHDRACPGCNALATSSPSMEEVTGPRVANVPAAVVDPIGHDLGREGRAGFDNSHAYRDEPSNDTEDAPDDKYEYSSDDMGSIHTESGWVFEDYILWKTKRLDRA